MLLEGEVDMACSRCGYGGHTVRYTVTPHGPSSIPTSTSGELCSSCAAEYGRQNSQYGYVGMEHNDYIEDVARRRRDAGVE